MKMKVLVPNTNMSTAEICILKLMLLEFQKVGVSSTNKSKWEYSV